MLIKNAPLSVLEDAAHATGARLVDVQDKSTRRAVQFRFRIVPNEDSKALDHFVRVSVGPSRHVRRVHALCWHGHTVFMARVFQQTPDAVIDTTFTRYANARDFAARYHTQTGPQTTPAIVGANYEYQRACLCDMQDQYAPTDEVKRLVESLRAVQDEAQHAPLPNTPLIKLSYAERLGLTQ